MYFEHLPLKDQLINYLPTFGLFHHFHMATSFCLICLWHDQSRKLVVLLILGTPFSHNWVNV